MSFWFWISVLGEIIIFPLYFWSLEHTKLREKFGVEKGNRIGDILGLISGWGYFLFLFGIWLSPQPQFVFPLLPEWSFIIPFGNTSIPAIHCLIFLVIMIPVLWLALMGVKEVTLKVAETHRPTKVVTSGVYNRIRHPQYLGGAVIMFSLILFTQHWLVTVFGVPAMIILYINTRQADTGLIDKFGEDYIEYMRLVPRWNIILGILRKLLRNR